ncbi:MAG TPA: Fe-S protein assembly co-chaperone HscB [Kofleriaceae bacterium]|nr:Fe-S protein assembly co-chaperone HscB [Kofleriaceae bacterium]
MTAATTPDPFALFGLAPRYDLDPAALEARFRERSRELHPDRQPNASAAERAQAMIRTRALNDAYQVLRRPEKRAEWLLARAGVTIGDNERLEPAFLMEFLELREELAEARAAGRGEAIGRLETAMRARREAHLAALPPLFQAVAASGAGDADALAAIKQHLIALRYVGRYLEECEAAQGE